MAQIQPTEFQINGINYTHTKLDAFTQLTIDRKGALLMVGLAHGEWYRVLHSMEQDDLDLLIKSIVPFVSRQDPGSKTWAPIYNKTANRFTYEDIGGQELLAIIFEILKVYLPDFIESVGLMVSGTQANETVDL